MYYIPAGHFHSSMSKRCVTFLSVGGEGGTGTKLSRDSTSSPSSKLGAGDAGAIRNVDAGNAGGGGGVGVREMDAHDEGCITKGADEIGLSSAGGRGGGVNMTFLNCAMSPNASCCPSSLLGGGVEGQLAISLMDCIKK